MTLHGRLRNAFGENQVYSDFEDTQSSSKHSRNPVDISDVRMDMRSHSHSVVSVPS